MIHLLTLLMAGFGLYLGAMGILAIDEISAYEIIGCLAVLALFFWIYLQIRKIPEEKKFGVGGDGGGGDGGGGDGGGD
jgi:hypothetical protein